MADPTHLPLPSEIPYLPGQPEYDEYIRGLTRGATIPITQAATGAVSLGMTPGQDVQPGPTESWLPGVVTRVGGGLLGTADAASKLIDAMTATPEAWIRNKLSMPDRGFDIRPTPEYVTRLEDLGESARKKAADIVQPVQPENPSEALLADVGDTVGTMAVPIPGAAITRLPSIVQKVVSPIMHVVAPLSTAHKVTPFLAGAAITGAQDIAAGALSPQDQGQQPQTSPPAQQPTPSTAKQGVADASAPVTQADASPTPQPAALVKQPAFQFSVPSGPIDQTQQQTPQQQATIGGFQFSVPTGPMQDSSTNPQSQTGDTGITFPEVLAGGVALTLPFLGLKYGRGAMERFGLRGPAERGPGTAYGQQAQEAETFRTQTNPDWTQKNVPPAPLAVAPAQAAAARVQTYAQDETALLRAHVAASDTSNEALAHEIGDVKNQAAQQSRIDSFMETGKHQASGVQTQPAQETLLQHGRLSDAQKDVVDNGLWAATELNHRTNMFNNAMQSGQPYDPLAARRYFRDNDDADLRNKVQAMLSDPQTELVGRGIWQMGAGNLDILRAMGYPTAEIARIAAQQPHYIPSVKEDGTPIHILDARDTDTFSGPRTPPTPAIDAFMQHHDMLMKRIENDVLNRKIIDSDALAKANDPNYSTMFSLKQTPSGDFASGNAEPSVVIPRSSGWETHLIHNPEIEQAMKASPTMKRAILQSTRNWFTQFTTGPGALLGGKFFPAIHGLTRGPYLQQLNTPADMYSSYLDRLYKRAGLPGSSGYHVLSPDPWLGAPAMAAKAMYDRAQHAASNMLMPDARIGRLLRDQWGNAKIDALQQRLADNYKNSLTAQWRASGGANSGIYGRMEVPAYQRSSFNNRVVSNPAANLAPRAITPASWVGKRMPFATNVNNLVREVFGAFMEAPNMYSYALNRDNPNLTQSRLVNESRAILGDPGKQGSGKVTQTLIRNLPYANATVQDVSRAARAKAEMPITRGINRSIMLGTGAAASIYTAMHTPGGLAHLLNLVSTNQNATGPILYNGNDTDNTTQISLPQSERAVWPIIRDFMLHMSGAWDAHKDENEFERAYHTLGSMFSQHVSNDALTSAAHGLSQSVDPFISMPPVIAGLMNLVTGKDPRLQADRIADQLLRGRSPSLSTDITPQSRSPNVAGQDSILGSADGNRWEHTLSSVFGLGGDLLETLDRGYGAWKHGEGFRGAAERMLDNIGQHYKDQNQTFNNILWNNATKISSSTPLVENTNKALDVMRDTMGTKTDIVSQGFTRAKGGVPLSGEAERKVSADPVVRNMRFVTSKAMDLINQKFMPQITDIKKLDSDLNNVSMDEDTRRMKHNEYMREINQAYIPIAQTVARLNEQLSRMSGTKIDISQGKIDWTRGSDQFNK